jgi:hypothetical protein
MKIGDSVVDAKAAFGDSDKVPRLLGRTDVFLHSKITFAKQGLEITFEAPIKAQLECLGLSL